MVAIGRNEGERLRSCLASVDISNVPVIYVDSGSTDGSVELAKRFGAQVVNLEMGHPFTAARARNAGLEALISRCPGVEFVQFVDGDCELESGWLSSAIEFLDTNPQVAVVCGRRRERYPEASFYNRICDKEWDTPVGETRSCGGDALMRAAAVTAAGGFDSALPAGEEPELCHRLRQQGWLVWRLHAPMTIHDAAMHRFHQWWLRAIRSGLGYAQAWRATSGRPQPLYRRESLRALGWTFGVSSIGAFAGLLFGWPAALAAPLIWALQFGRLAARHGGGEASLLLLGKAAETLGIIAYLSRAIVGRPGGTIFYK